MLDRLLLREIGPSTVLSDRPIAETIREAIQGADVVVAVVGARSSVANVAYELGIATALRRRIVLVADPAANLPSSWQGLFMIHARPANVAAVEFRLRAYLRHELKSPIPPGRVPERAPVTTDALPALAHHAARERAPPRHRSRKGPEEARQPAGAYLADSAAEAQVAAIFERAGLEVIWHPTKQRSEFDLAVWIVELEAVLGNPLLVEVSGQANQSAGRSALENFRAKLEAIGRPAGLWVTSGEGVPFSAGARLPLVISASIADLERLRDRSQLVKWLVEQRNQIVHGGQPARRR